MLAGRRLLWCDRPWQSSCCIKNGKNAGWRVWFCCLFVGAIEGATRLNNLILPINLPDIVAEVSDAFLQYESALLANDVTVLNDFFLDATFTVRFGLAEHSY